MSLSQTNDFILDLESTNIKLSKNSSDSFTLLYFTLFTDT